MPKMTGAKYLAGTLKAYGVTHVFFVPATLRRSLAEMDLLGIKRVVTHGEKAAAYMADGYARMAHRPAVCMCQNVGAANLAAGLQDAYLGGSPVVALTGPRARAVTLEEVVELSQAGIGEVHFEVISKMMSCSVVSSSLMSRAISTAGTRANFSR